MKIGLIDVDSHNFPNLALMRISSFHKSLGDEVTFYDPMFGGFYDVVYVSKVFDFTEDYPYEINAETVLYGGAGYKVSGDIDMDRVMPDYSLYGITDTAYGYLTRGCYNHCPYCIVPKIEGNLVKKVADVTDFWAGQKYIKIMDSNLLGLADRQTLIDLLRHLAETGSYIDFTQGLDIRALDDELINLLMKMKIKMIHFAWDDPKDGNIPLMLERFHEKTGWERHKVSVYILTNFWSTKDQDLDRIYTVRDIGFSPYMMIYNKHLLPKGHELLRMQRWCNNKRIFYSSDF